MKTISIDDVREVIRLAEICSSREGSPRGVKLSEIDALVDDPNELALSDKISSLSKEELSELCALMWLGRGDGGEVVGDWENLVADAAARDSERLVDYIAAKLPLGKYLRDGLAKLGLVS